ncbi:MAG: c-type cytochrome [Rhizomicrobium sp.]|jgi:cytochrome c
MDSFEWNKIAGAVLGTLLFVVAVRIASGLIFEVEPPAKPGYIVQGVETASTGTAAAPAEEQLPDWGTVLPKASVADGKSISSRCEQCHDLSKGGPNKIGPGLWAVVGRPRASHPGFDYSSAMKSKGGSWSYDELFKFLKSPGAYIPGTKMSFAGLPKTDDRINLISYLRTDMDSPAPIPPPHPASPEPAQTPGNGQAPATAPNAGAPKTTQGPNGTAAVAPGNQPANATSTAGSGNAASGSAGNANGPSGGDTGKDSSVSGSEAHIGNAPAPATGKQPSTPPKKP